MKNEILAASSLCVNFGPHEVLKDVHFSVRKGEVFALLGGNGAGKSTALKTFIGTVRPSAGEVRVLGMLVQDHLADVRSAISYLPESVMLYGHLSGFENVAYFLSLARMKRSRQEIEGTFDRVALQAEAWSRPLKDYSKGMRQKAAIALALLRKTPVLLLDEPTSGLDPGAIDEFNHLIATLSAEGTTVFIVTHDVYGACQVAHRIGLLGDGKIVGEFTREGDTPIDTEAVHRAFSERSAS